MPSEARRTLPKFRRIGRREKFDLSPGAKIAKNDWFIVYARKNRFGISRIGITVSKRIAPSAPARNFAKRLVREGFRRSFPIGASLNVVVRVRRQLERKTADEGVAALLKLFLDIQV